MFYAFISLIKTVTVTYILIKTNYVAEWKTQKIFKYCKDYNWKNIKLFYWYPKMENEEQPNTVKSTLW